MEQQYRLALAAVRNVQLKLAKLKLLVRDCGHAVSLSSSSELDSVGFAG